MNKARLLRITLTILSVVLLREPAAQIFCTEKWRRSLKFCSVSGLLQKLKYIFGLCSLRTIMLIFKRGLLENEVDIIRAVGQCILSRGMQDAWQVDDLMQQYRMISGNSKIFQIHWSCASIQSDTCQ